MKSTRRSFLLGAAAAASTLALPEWTLAEGAAGDRVLGFGRAMRPDGSPLFVAGLGAAGATKPGMFEMPFFGHGVAFRPDLPHRAFVFEKRGPGSCEIDLRNERVVRKIVPRRAHHYYGHGAIIDGGERVLAVETELSTHRGVMVIRDAKSLKDLGAFPTYGLDPHDCHLIENGKVLVVANAGGPAGGDKPNVSFIDVKTHKLLDQVSPPAEHVNTGHVTLGPKGDLVVVSAARNGLPLSAEGGVAIRPAGAAIAQAAWTAELGPMTGEALSIAVDPARRIAAVTHPDANLVSFWNLESGRFLSSLGIEKPRGLANTRDGRNVVVSHGAGNLGLIAWSTRQLVPTPRHDETPFGGSHLYRVDAKI